MESILRQRQMMLWEAVCKEYAVNTKKASQVSAWIHEGTFFENVDQVKSKSKSKPDSKSSSRL